MTIKFPQKGIYDNKPTPKTLYDIITQELKFTDVCLDRSKFNAAVNYGQTTLTATRHSQTKNPSY